MHKIVSLIEAVKKNLWKLDIQSEVTVCYRWWTQCANEWEGCEDVVSTAVHRLVAVVFSNSVVAVTAVKELYSFCKYTWTRSL